MSAPRAAEETPFPEPAAPRPLRMMCVPYAGAGAGVYRGWRQEPGTVLEVVPIQLPGREEEFTAPFHRTVRAAAADVAGRVADEADGAPFVLFGHSLGALLAYEATRHLREIGGPLPRHLVVSGSASPRRRRPEKLSDDPARAVAQLRELTGQPDAFADPEIRDLLLPALRADLAMSESYRPQPHHPLPVPLTALRGTADTSVPAADWRDWAAYTSAGFRTVEFPGGHMYLTESWPDVLRAVAELV
ncbi:thioesterase II family protein [Streptomyces misionensis]|uniref:thioesterase II family protein n=1 Tax=Streptomyces misionensis TaxID=67331 RepID=UPI0016466D55|nr:alpha/beta fold hydrolase [Streptomyces misionensis]